MAAHISSTSRAETRRRLLKQSQEQRKGEGWHRSKCLLKKSQELAEGRAALGRNVC